MSSIKIKYSIPNEKSFSRSWDQLAHVPDDLRVPFEQMADQFLQNNLKTFTEEGPGWKPLAASTLADKARKGFGAMPILVRTERLKQSLTEAGSPDSIRRIRRQAMELGTSTPYAIYHQTGSIKVENRPPKRSPIVFRAQLRKQWTNTMTKYLRDQMAIITGGGE